MEPKYKVNPLTGELQEYVFEYNGILALRNFTARVEDERLILHAADDVNFSILEALVSEVEINGVVYDNPTAAQEALTRLTFNQNRPVLLDKTLKELILGAVQKIPGKKLTTEDFTTELRQKLEGLQQVDTSGLLPKGGYTGTAQDLKNLIDAINRILQSDDTDLDQLQEIVTYIKQNKHILSTLGISNIAGLVEALAAKAEKDHHHDDRYAPKEHHHNEYAIRTHRHNKDDIDGLPANIATTDNIKTAIEGIQIGGRNLILKSRFVKNELGNWSDYQDDIFGNVVRIDRPVNNGNFQHLFTLVPYNYNNKDLIFMVIAKPLDNGSFNFGRWINSFEAISVRNGTAIKNTQKKDLGDGWSIYWSKVNMSYLGDGSFGLNSVEGSWLFYTCGLFEGNTLVSWSPAPEDIMPTQRAGASISTNWTAVVEHQNNTIFVENSLSIELNQLQNMGSISFIKTFDTGAVTFTCAGKNIIYPFDNTFNGKKGSTAVVSIHNNDCYIRISNV